MKALHSDVGDMPTHSSRENLIATLCRYGKPIYGKQDLIWYYMATIIVPTGRVIDSDRLCTIKFITGDMNYGESAIYVKWENQVERLITKDEESNPLYKWLVTKYIK